MHLQCFQFVIQTKWIQQTGLYKQRFVIQYDTTTQQMYYQCFLLTLLRVSFLIVDRVSVLLILW